MYVGANLDVLEDQLLLLLRLADVEHFLDAAEETHPDPLPLSLDLPLPLPQVTPTLSQPIFFHSLLTHGQFKIRLTHFKLIRGQ